jgi:hypothetical protein
MKMIAVGLVLWLALGAVGSAGAVDLTKIDRSIRKKPVYQSKDPQYCLLVFGPEAKVRVWLVLDGDVLYVDRNGDGDLTEPNKRIAPYYALHNSPKRPDMKVMRLFLLPRPVRDGKPEREPVFSCLPGEWSLIVEQFIPVDDREDEGADQLRKRPFHVDLGNRRFSENCALAFAARPGDAPILHSDGPRQLALDRDSDPLRRGETSSLVVCLKTPGLGASLCTYRAEGMEGIHPLAEVECPPRQPGADPVRFRLELSGRG